MKVSITKETKRKITMAQAEDALPTLVKYYKENDDSTPADYAKIAASHIFRAFTDKHDPIVTILSASARVDRNTDAYGWIDGTDDLDVWITFTACDGSEIEYCDHMVTAGCYVSDICKMSDYPSRESVWQKYTFRLFEEIASYSY